jgi:hypothetical protein
MFAVPRSPTNRNVVRSISGNKSSNPSASQSNPEDEDREEQKRREASWKATKYCLIAFGAALGLVGSYTIYELGWFTVQITVWMLCLTTFQNHKNLLQCSHLSRFALVYVY